MSKVTQTQVESGTLRGVESRTGVVAFKGIPYAKPPVDDLRWRPPAAPEPWDGVRYADRYGAVCPQPVPPANSLYYGGTEPQSEDCLFLNVWTSDVSPAQARPVIVWLHMGAFAFGSGSAGQGPFSIYDGSELAAQHAVVVTVNYRVGRLGFLAHPWLSEESGRGASGNYGLMDQIAALDWVQRNIAAFGGDPGNVTLWGVSAGAASTSIHLASPLASGLFHKAIAMSGGLFGPASDSCGLNDLMQDLASAERTGVVLASELGVASLAELREVSPEDLAMAMGTPGEWRTHLVPFGVGSGAFDSSYPIVDGHVLTKTPFEVFSAGEQHDVPVIAGSAANEAAGAPGLDTLENFERYAHEEYGDLADRFVELYPADDDAGALSATTRVVGDRIFAWPTWTLAHLHASTATSDVFYYRWSHESPIPTDFEVVEGTPGAFHTSEVAYLFRHIWVWPWNWTESDRAISETASNAWLRFARTGDPNGEELPEWPAFNPGAPRVMDFAERAAMGEVPDRARLEFLDDYYARLRTGGAVGRA